MGHILTKEKPAKVYLQKFSPLITVNLNWLPTTVLKHIEVQKPGFWNRLLGKTYLETTSVPVNADLDLGCMYEYVDPTSGELKKGVIQALGNLMGNPGTLPYIYLDKDDRSGAAQNGENLMILAPEYLKRVLIFTYLYPSPGVTDFSKLGAQVKIEVEDGETILVNLDAPRPGKTFCSVVMLEYENGNLDAMKLTKVESYETSHREADAAFGFGFDWTEGLK
jgi:tellurite resistance protein TerA